MTYRPPVTSSLAAPALLGRARSVRAATRRCGRAHATPATSARRHDRYARRSPRCGIARSSGTGKFALMPSTRSISLTSSLTLAFAWLRTSLSFGPAIAWRSSVLHPDLEVLDARDVHAADEEHVVGRLDDREHVVVEHRRQVDRPRDRRSCCSVAQMFTISPGSSASVGIGSIGAGSTSSPLAGAVAASVCTSSMSPYSHRGGGVEHRVLRRQARASPTRRRTAGRRRPARPARSSAWPSRRRR